MSGPGRVLFSVPLPVAQSPSLVVVSQGGPSRQPQERVCPISPSRAESLGVDGHPSVRIQRTVGEEASTCTKASAGREAVSQVPEQRPGAADADACCGRFPCPPPLAWDLAAVLSSLFSF